MLFTPALEDPQAWHSQDANDRLLFVYGYLRHTPSRRQATGRHGNICHGTEGGQARNVKISSVANH